MRCPPPIRRGLALSLAAPLMAACAPALTSPPAVPPVAEEPTQRIFLADGGGIRVEDDPYSRRPIRRADHDAHVTKIADRVALVVEPQPAMPAAISNLLGAALVRRFQGQLPHAEALAAPRVFFIRPALGLSGNGEADWLLVDWQLRTADGRNVGAVYASRRLSGAPDNDDPLTAFTVEDAEHIALQTAAHLLDTYSIRAAMADARRLALIDDTPAPLPRPKRPGIAKPVAPAPATEAGPPPPRPRPISLEP